MATFTFRVQRDGELIDTAVCSGSESALLARFDAWTAFVPGMVGDNLAGTTVDAYDENGYVVASHTFTE